MTAKRGLDVLSTGDTMSPLPKGFFGKDRYGPFRVDNTRLGALQARALAEGAVRLEHGPVWDVSGRGKWGCSDPLDISLLTCESAKTEVGPALRLLVRCRKCDSCLKAKSAFWKLRAMAEIGWCPRTWFVTLTFDAAWRTRAEYAASLRLRKAGIDKPSATDLFGAKLSLLAPEVTKWLKRVRKGLASEGEQPVSFRYLLVWEAHTDGFPHAHILLHEQTLADVSKRRIQRHWTAGFSTAKLVGEGDLDPHKSAAYVCKYIAKASLSRVRASRAYGVD